MKKIFTVVEHNRLDCIEKCLKSIKDTAKCPEEVKVLYFDSGTKDVDSLFSIIKKLSSIDFKKGSFINYVDENWHNDENIGPARARNDLWLKTMKEEKDPYLLIKYDGNNEMIMQDWDVKIDEYFKDNPFVGAICFGKEEQIDMTNVINRSYNFIVVRSGYAKVLGGFRDFKYITGLPWGLDDIDYAIKLQCETTFMSLDWKISRKVDRPPEMSATGKPLYESMCEKDPEGKRFVELTRLYQEKYSKMNYDWENK